MIPKNVLDELSRWINEKRYGNVQINFAGGKIINLNLNESKKVESLGVFLTTDSTNTRS